jgi:RNA polymerase sigma-70 factor (ECF subfamily)
MPDPPPDLARLYDAHAAPLYAFLLNLTRNESDTRDLLQDLFCKLAARPSLLDGIRNESAFLHRTAYHLFIDHTRRRSIRHAPSDLSASPRPTLSASLFIPAPDPDESAFRAALDEALAQLPANQRAVVHLKLWSGLTFAEIADALAIPPNTAASRYRYAIDKLRALLRPIYEEIQ